MTAKDIRWIQRLDHFNKAFFQLKDAVELSQQRKLSKLEEQGLIQAFEFTHELAWNTLKDFLESRGAQNLYGSKDVIREAFKRELLADGDVWMDMISKRNLTSHTYDETTAAKIAAVILETYFNAFEKMRLKLEQLRQGEPA